MLQAVVDALRTLSQNQVDANSVARQRVEKQQGNLDIRGRRRKLQQQLESARRTRLGAYKDKAAGILSEEEFLAISEDLRKEESSCQRELDRLARWEDDQDQTRIIEQKVKAFLRFDHLEKSQLQQLVRRVEVDAHKHITIAFNFTDPGKGAD